jgi:hypothetical protein
MGLKAIITSYSTYFSCLLELIPDGILKSVKSSHVIYPTGKLMAPHLQRCKGFAVNYYSCTFDALDLQHPRLLQGLILSTIS